MRKYLSLFLGVVLLLNAGAIIAQTAAPTDNSADSFADIASLGQEIAIAQRKIQAMTLKNSLDALQAQQATGNFSFKVLRVEGFNQTLYAVLVDDAGVVYQVGPGDLIANQYRVSMIRPYAVSVFDVTARKTYAVPFVVGGAGALMNDFSERVAPTTVDTASSTSK